MNVGSGGGGAGAVVTAVGVQFGVDADGGSSTKKGSPV